MMQAGDGRQSDTALILLASRGHFERAGENATPIVEAALGLDLLVRTAIHDDDFAVVAPAFAASINSAIFRAVPIISDAVAPGIPPERVYFGLGCAAALVTTPQDAFHTDRLLYAGWLLGELRAFLCRAEIDRRDDPLGRVVQARRVWDAAQPHLAPVQ